MKKVYFISLLVVRVLLFVFLLFALNVSSFSQCNTDVSICTQGVAEPPPNAQTGSSDAEITPPTGLIAADDPLVIPAVVGGGSWSADCGACIDPSTGIFDPAIAGEGEWEVCHSVGSPPCDDSDCQAVVVQPAPSPPPPGDCGDTVTDSGGSNGDYSNNENITYTYCSDDPNQTVTLTFTSFNIESGWDFLDIYLGPDATSNYYGTYSGSNSPGTITSNNGCITLVFDSDNIFTDPGWVAVFECLTPCQEIDAQISSISQPADGSNGEVLACQGDNIAFTADASYPENNTNYAQSNSTSTFEWNFGDGTTGNGMSVNHNYANEGIYPLLLTVTDIQGCTDFVQQTIFVSTTPVFLGTTVDQQEICLGETNVLTGVVNPVPVVLECNPVDAEVVALPDGNGQTYVSPIVVSCFSANQVITNINDLESICLNMEHSWLGDLQIEIECPSGESVVLLEYPNSAGGTYLGIPNQSDSPNLVGTGWDYCFTNNPTYGQLDSNLPGSSQPSGSYTSENPLSALIGCQLNGEWSISITDNQPLDNGFLFSWGVTFNPSIIPPDTDFTPVVVSEGWLADPTILSTSGNSITVEPTTAGSNCYTYQMTDDFGCVYDTTVCFNVLPTTDASFTLTDFCFDQSNSATITGDAGGEFSFNPEPEDGATINSTTGAIFNGVEGTTYFVDYFVDGTCPDTQNVSVTVVSLDDPHFAFDDFCVGQPNAAYDIATPGGTFTFNPPVVDGATIDATTGEITGGVAGTMYAVQYETNGTCPDIEIRPVNVLPQDDASFTITDFCEGEVNVATITGTPGGIFDFNIDPADGSSINPNSGELTDAVGGTTYYIEYTTTGGCPDSQIESVVVFENVDAGEDGFVTVCVNSGGVVLFDYLGGTPDEGGYWLYPDNSPMSGVFDPLNDPEGDYIYHVDADGTCPFDESIVSVSVNEEITVTDITQTCEADQLNYIVTFTINGCDAATYSVTGAWTMTNNTFTSDLIPSGSTYSFDVTDGNACNTETVSGTFSCSCPAAATLSGSAELCEGETGSLQVDFAGNGGWTFVYAIDGVEQPAISTGDNPYTLDVTEGGTYTLVSVNDANCPGGVTGEASVVVHDLPTAQLLNDIEICQGEDAQLEMALTGTGPWNVQLAIDDEVLPDAIIITENSYSITEVQSGIYSIVSISDEFCTNSNAGTAQVVIHEIPSGIMSGGGDICPGDSTAIEFNFSGESPWEYEYTIDGVVQGPFISESNQETVYVSQPGDFELTQVSNQYCDGIFDGEVVVEESVASQAIIDGNIEFCQGESGVVEVELEGGSLYVFSYALNGEIIDTVSTTAPMYQIPVSEPGTYTIEEMFTSGCPSIFDGFASVVVDELPVATISGDITLCENASSQLAVSLEGNAPFSITYSMNGVEVDTVEGILDSLYFIDVDGGGEYSLLSVSDAQCSGLVFGVGEVNIVPLPVGIVSGGDEVCEGEEVNIQFNLEGNPNWTIEIANDGLVIDTIEVSESPFSYPVESSGTYTIASLSSQGCSSFGIGFANVVINELPTANITGDAAICAGEPAVIDVEITGTPGFDLVYAYNGIEQPAISTTSENYQIIVSDEGQYTLVSISDQHCDGIVSGMSNVTVEDLPTASISGSYQICSNATQSIEVPVTGEATWELTYSIDGVLQPVITSETSPLIISVSAEGEYEIVLISDDNCFNLGEGLAEVEYYPPISLDITEDQSICDGEEVMISGSATGGMNQGYNYSWIASSGQILTNPSEVVSPTETTSYTFWVYDACGIVYTDSLTIDVHPIPEVSFESNPPTLCGNHATAVIYNTTDEEFQGSCTWNVNGEYFYTCDSLIHDFASVGSYDLGLQVTSPFGCVGVAYEPNFIHVYPSPAAMFYHTPNNPTILFNTVEFENQSLGATSYQWDFAGLDESTEENPTYTFPYDGAGVDGFLVCLTATNDFGCVDTTCHGFELEGELLVYVPNAFTPNGDLINDLFIPVITGGDPLVYEFSIYNRWSERFFYTEDIHEGWNGTYEGALEMKNKDGDYYVPDGVYNWVITIKRDEAAEKRRLTGRVIILR